MATFTIKFNKSDCIGCGMCAEECSSNWVIKDTSEGRKAKPKATTLSSIGCNQRAADSCPVGAIEIEKKGRGSSGDDLGLMEEDYDF